MRKFEFPVDVAHAKSVNETFTELRRLRSSAALTAVFLIALGAWFIWIAAPWSYILGAVFLIGAATSLWVMLWAPRKMGSIESQYAAGDLVPAVVAEKLPGGAILLALVDIAKPEVDEPHYVLITRVVRALPGHAVERGAQVPAVSVLADRGRNTGGRTWQLASAMPIAWGTTDQGGPRARRPGDHRGRVGVAARQHRPVGEGPHGQEPTVAHRSCGSSRRPALEPATTT
ncbi:MAG: DUF3239 domain-containing protein [Rhodococcus sp. (in: high G+C Gram-positive bacteria)]|nr:DUF3239 domain-containing protein [Rhodococcus sp. (in: high G+C Gram-positive bacteria)]